MAAASIDRRKTQTVLLGVVCFGIVVLLSFLFVYPKARQLRAQHLQLAELGMTLKEQQALQPFYGRLITTINRKKPADLSCPPLKKLSREGTRELTTVFQSIAGQSDLRLATVVPIVDDADTMQVDLVYQGGFLQFRSLLLELGRLPYVKRIEYFTVQSLGNECEIQLRLSIEQVEP